ncbi:MAG TPA: IPT/TIG domain-containing protein [Pantanalinema sp.]
MRKVMTTLLLAGLGGCALFPGASDPIPELSGRVDFGAPLRTQATLDEVGVAATVTLIGASDNRAVSSALTDAGGRFVLSFRGWKPTTGEVYYLEAIKGLNQNLAGSSAARVRTLGGWTSGGWKFLTQGGIIITTGTTAVAILTSHLGTASVPVDGLVGKMIAGTPDASLMPTTADTFQHAGTGITNAQFHKVYELVDQALAQETDPMDRIVPLGPSFVLKAGTGLGGYVLAPTLHAAVPTEGPVGSLVTLYGLDFAGASTDNAVYVGNKRATVISSDPNQLVVQVPAGAATGNLTVRTQGGTSAALPFTVTAIGASDIGGTFAPR